METVYSITKFVGCLLGVGIVTFLIQKAKNWIS